MSAKERTKRKLQERIESGKSIRYNDIRKDDTKLFYAIDRYGGLLKLCQELGLSENELVSNYGLTRNINARTLSEEEMSNRLLYLKSIGRLSTSAMRTEFDDLRLEQSIKKIYGSVQQGLEHFGLTRDTVRHSEKSIIRDIYSLSEEIEDMSYTNALSKNKTLVYNATNILKKGWHNILIDLNIDFESKYKQLDRENVAIRLRKIYDSEGEINYPLIQKYDSSILYYAYENYENIVEFYLDMGIDPNDCMDFSKQTVKGFAFEQVFKKLLDLMQVEYVFNSPFQEGLRPDFRLNRGTWIDCKLSAWTSSIEDTVERYTPHCDKLIIVFLRGEYRHLPETNNSKVVFRKIDYYYPFLHQINRQDLIEEFENIINNDKFTESVTTERLIS